MEAQDAGFARTTRIAKGVGRQDKETGKHEGRGLRRSGCKSSQSHSFMSGE